MAKTVVGLFDNSDEAQTVVQELISDGFPQADIGVIASSGVDGGFDETVDGEVRHTAEEDTVKGAGTGAVVGGLAGLLVGLGAFAIPGIGPIVAAGPIAAALTGIGIGAVAGGLMAALIHVGVPEDEAHYYAEGIRRGGTLVTVKTDADSASRAAHIFQKHQAVDIGDRAGASPV